MSIKTIHLTNNWHAESGGVATFYRQMLKAAERRGRAIRLVVPSGATIGRRCGSIRGRLPRQARVSSRCSTHTSARCLPTIEGARLKDSATTRAARIRARVAVPNRARRRSALLATQGLCLAVNALGVNAIGVARAARS